MRQKALTLIIAALLFTACEPVQKTGKAAPAPVPVRAATPAIKDVPVYIETMGTLLPSVLMEVRPQVNGVLENVFVHEGNWVKEGTPLFRIDQKSYIIKVQEAEAQLSMDRAALLAAEKKLERFKSLAQKDLIAKTEWDELKRRLPDRKRLSKPMKQGLMPSSLTLTVARSAPLSMEEWENWMSMRAILCPTPRLLRLPRSPKWIPLSSNLP